jgi:DNA-binding Lrp family transcriptional regulator
MKAYILIAIKEGQELKVLEKVKQLNEVSNAYLLFGEWDLIAEIDLPNNESLGTFILEKIRTLEGIRLTSSLITASK